MDYKENGNKAITCYFMARQNKSKGFQEIFDEIRIQNNNIDLIENTASNPAI